MDERYSEIMNAFLQELSLYIVTNGVFFSIPMLDLFYSISVLF